MDAAHGQERLIWASSAADARSFLSQARLEYMLGAIIENKLYLLDLDPSAGAELVVLCEKIEIVGLSSFSAITLGKF
jgi:hypothetical protein